MKTHRNAAWIAVVGASIACGPVWAQIAADTPAVPIDAPTSAKVALPLSSAVPEPSSVPGSPAVVESPKASSQSVPVPSGRALVRVEPFVAVGDSGAMDWLSQAVAQTVATALARESQVDVITNPDAQTQYVVTGTWQPQGDQIRLTASLVEQPGGTIVDSAETTGPSRDLFALQDAIAMQIRSAVVSRIYEPASTGQTTAGTGVAVPPTPQADAQPPAAAGPGFAGSDLQQAVKAGTVLGTAVAAAPPVDSFRNGNNGFGFVPGYGSAPGSGWGWRPWFPGGVVVVRPGDGATPEPDRDFSRGTGNVMGGQRMSATGGTSVMSPGGSNVMAPGSGNVMRPGSGNVMRPPAK